MLQILTVILALTTTQLMDLYGHLTNFCDQESQVLSGIAGSNQAKLKQLDGKHRSIGKRFELWSAKNADAIAESEVLAQLLEQYSNLSQSCADSIANEGVRAQMRVDYKSASQYLDSKKALYDEMVEQSKLLSAVSQTANQLKQLQAKEKVEFAQIQAKFDLAHAAAQALPGYESLCTQIEEMFQDLQAKSTIIQEAQYVPFVTRIKDYLIGLACVSMILNFLNMVKTKIDAAKQLKAGQAKMKEMLDKANDPLPQI